MEAIEKDIERFLAVSSGSGYGSGYGYGYGSGYGYGYGDGDGDVIRRVAREYGINLL